MGKVREFEHKVFVGERAPFYTDAAGGTILEQYEGERVRVYENRDAQFDARLVDEAKKSKLVGLLPWAKDPEVPDV